MNDVNFNPVYRIHLNEPKSGLKAFVIIDSVKEIGVATGGIRMTPDVSLEEIERLARAMTYKLALIGSPLGGAKTGIVYDTKLTTRNEVLKTYGRLMKPLLQEMYLPGTDLGTTQADLSLIFKEAGLDPTILIKRRAKELGFWLNDRYGTSNLPDYIKKDLSPQNGMKEIIGGLGVVASTEAACQVLNMKLSDSRVSIQGFGSIGSYTAKYLVEKGAKIVSISDINGAIINEDGLLIGDLIVAKDDFGCVDRSKLKCNYRESHDGDAWLSVDADIIIPAAGTDSITETKVPNIKAKLCVQGANIPVTSDAERAMHEKGIVVVPDIVANAGTAGLTLGFCEKYDFLLVDEICFRIKEMTKKVLDKNKTENLTSRQAAINIAKDILFSESD